MILEECGRTKRHHQDCCRFLRSLLVAIATAVARYHIYIFFRKKYIFQKLIIIIIIEIFNIFIDVRGSRIGGDTGGDRRGVGASGGV